MKNLVLLLALLAGSLSSAIAAAQVCNPDIALENPDSQYIDHNDGTVTDNKTGLMWMQCSLGLQGAACTTGTAEEKGWAGALASAQAVNNSDDADVNLGYADWRLPNIRELSSLLENACQTPAINISIFPETKSSNYWSASPAVYSSTYAWFVNFNLGYEDSGTKSGGSGSHYIRLVRDGQ